MRMGFLFPGQGSQYVGMGRKLYEQYPAARATFAEADAALDFPLSRLCFAGPEDELRQTANTQPAILTVSVACYSLLAERGISPSMAAGHSLGEYSALVSAGALDFTDAVRLVRDRGLFMEEAVPDGEGTMGAILGLSADAVDEICKSDELTGVVEPATYNGPGQVVVAGETHAVDQVLELAKQAGARRAQRLKVSGPFHSSLLTPAGERLSEILAGIEIQHPRVPVVANVSADYVPSAAAIRKALVNQVSRPVRWEESVRRMVDDGAEVFVEVGPGSVLSGLVRRIARDVPCYSVEDGEGLEKVLALQKGDSVR